MKLQSDAVKKKFLQQGINFSAVKNNFSQQKNGNLMRMKFPSCEQ